MNISKRRGAGPRIAVIGSGIAGLAASWLMARNGCPVTLIEAAPKPGGHSNTVEVCIGGKQVNVDTGFIVYNEHTYPNLTRLFHETGVATAPSNMSFAVSTRTVEYAGTGLRGLFAQPWNLLRPRFLAMLASLVRFYRDAPGMRPPAETTLRQMLDNGGYSKAFAEDHLLPMMAAIWSADASDVGDMQAQAFLDFFTNHGLLQFSNRPQWRTVQGGSRAYVETLLRQPGLTLEPASPVTRVERRADGVWVATKGGAQRFDQVVLATHADRSLELLANPSEHERRVLGAFAYTPSTAWLHTDPTLMPKRRSAWASWNYIATDDGRLCVTYWMNRLQQLNTDRDVFVTLNPPSEPRGVLGRYEYNHPVLNTVTAAMRRRLWSLQGAGGVWFCGAYFGYGFHEDGLQAGLAVAEQLTGTRRPWTLPNPHTRVYVTAPRRRPTRVAA